MVMALAWALVSIQGFHLIHVGQVGCVLQTFVAADFSSMFSCHSWLVLLCCAGACFPLSKFCFQSWINSIKNSIKDACSSTSNNYQPLSTTFSHIYPHSSTFINFHPLLTTFNHFHPCWSILSISSTFIHFHPLSPTFIHTHPIASTHISHCIHSIHIHPISSIFIHFSHFIHFRPLSLIFFHLHPCSPTSIHFYPLSSMFIHFHLLSYTFIHFHPGGLSWSVSDHHRMIFDTKTYIKRDGWKSTALRC